MAKPVKVNTAHFKQIDKLETGRVWQLKSAPKEAFITIGELAVDWDGHPMAYANTRRHPELKPKDYIGNAGGTGNWWGVVTDTGENNGTPIEQSGNDVWFGNGPLQPYKGYMISKTKLADTRYPQNDIRRWVDAATVPFIALPNSRNSMKSVHLKTGCFALLIDLQTLNYCFAVYADSKAAKARMGEASKRACNILGSTSGRVLMIVFPQSGRGQGTIPMEATIQAEGRELLKQYSLLDAESHLLDAFADIPGVNTVLAQAGYVLF